MKQRRSRNEVIHDMLFAIQEKGGAIKPTHLLYKANLSHDALQRYLEELMDAGLVSEEKVKGGKKNYVLEEAGHKFLEKYRHFKEFSDAFGI